MYQGEKVLNECTVDEMIKLLTNGVFQDVIDANAKKNKPSALEGVENWQTKIIEYFTKNDMSGEKFVNAPVKETCKDIMDYLEKGNNKLRGGVNQVIRGLKKCYVHELLDKNTTSRKSNDKNTTPMKQQSMPDDKETYQMSLNKSNDTTILEQEIIRNERLWRKYMSSLSGGNNSENSGGNNANQHNNNERKNNEGNQSDDRKYDESNQNNNNNNN
eukprot:274494_1